MVLQCGHVGSFSCSCSSSYLNFHCSMVFSVQGHGSSTDVPHGVVPPESIDPVPWHDLHAGSGLQWFIGYLPSSSWMALLISVMASCRSWVVVFLLSFRCPGCSNLMIAFWIAGMLRSML